MSVTDAVRQNEIVPRSIEELPLAEELPGKFLTQKVAPLAGRPVHDEHRIANDPLAVALRACPACGSASAARAAFRRMRNESCESQSRRPAGRVVGPSGEVAAVQKGVAQNDQDDDALHDENSQFGV